MANRTEIAEKCARAADELTVVRDQWQRVAEMPELQAGQTRMIAVLRSAAALLRATEWQPIETAPTDGTLFLAYAPAYEGLPEMFSLCAWHQDAGFCIDELRTVTHWRPLIAPLHVPRKQA